MVDLKDISDVPVNSHVVMTTKLGQVRHFELPCIRSIENAQRLASSFSQICRK